MCCTLKYQHYVLTLRYLSLEWHFVGVTLAT